MNNETMIDLILDNDAFDIEEFYDLFRELFDNKINEKYYEDTELSLPYQKAIECLFDSSLEIDERIENALSFCTYCFEAYYFFKMTSEERDIFNYADILLYSAKDNNPYTGLSDYEKTSVTMILDDISSIYMFRDNYRKAVTAIFAAKDIDESTFVLSRIKLHICYEKLEDYHSFKRFYDDGSIDDLVSYLLYICVLIKTLKTDEISEVLMDMFHDYPESYDVIKYRFLEEEYTADEETELAFEVSKSSTESIPNFYDILIDVIRKNNISPNNLEN